VKNKLSVVLMGAALLLSSFGAHGGVYKADFSFHGFTDTFALAHSPPQIAPQMDVSGSVVYSAATMYAPSDSLLSIDLEILGHRYTLTEAASGGLDFFSPVFGAVVNGATSMISGSPDLPDDFILVIRDPSLGVPNRLSYTAPGYTSFISTNSLTVVTEVAGVPEPSSGLLIFGAAVAAGTVRRRRNTP
jgi:hypothetical protein